ncbi:MAG: cysteine rich repeat-containing protein [Hyphomicrobium sp.]
MNLKAKFVLAALVGGVFTTCTASAQQSIVGEVSEKCAPELKTYCKGVTLGGGRVAACLYAYEDKLSVQCAVAVYRGVDDFFAANANLQVYERQCSSDLLQYCSDVAPGGGRLYECIKSHKATLTDACRAALAKAGPDMKRLGLSR